MDYREFFKNKKITLLGLGLIGKGFINPAFLAECGAEIIATDLKSEEELKPTIEKLKQYSNITFHLGGHRFEDFENVDLVIKNQGVPLDSPYVKYAKEHNVKVEMDEALFARLAPEVQIIGITGTRGKSTTAHLIYKIIKDSGRRVFLSGNLPNSAVLPLLKEVRAGDIVVLELSSWQLQGFGEDKISPHISVFTTFMDDHLSYYHNDRDLYFDDKANIYKFQTKDDFVILGEDIYDLILSRGDIESKVIKASRSDISSQWNPKIKGDHNKLNISCAIRVAEALNIDQEIIKKSVESFDAVEGRLQLVSESNGICIYNDNNATTPDATIQGLKSLSQSTDKKIILICGGSDKGLSLDYLIEEINKKCKKVIVLPGTGTNKFIEVASKANLNLIQAENLSEAFKLSLDVATSGDTILFSPAFASFGLFKNEYDRNDQFMNLVRDWIGGK